MCCGLVLLPHSPPWCYNGSYITRRSCCRELQLLNLILGERQCLGCRKCPPFDRWIVRVLCCGGSVLCSFSKHCTGHLQFSFLLRASFGEAVCRAEWPLQHICFLLGSMDFQLQHQPNCVLVWCNQSACLGYCSAAPSPKCSFCGFNVLLSFLWKANR